MTAPEIAELIRDRLDFTYARSGGPGGQNVNKVSTKVVARIPLSALSFLPPNAVRMVETRLASRLNAERQIVLSVQDTREQARNREIAVQRVAGLIAGALKRPKQRVKTRPSRAAREARLRMKKLRSSAKRLRKAVFDD